MGRPKGSKNIRQKVNTFKLVESGKYASLQVRNKEGKIKGTILIDAEDLPIAQQYVWNLNPRGYAQSRTRGGREGSKAIYLHRLIMKVGPGEQVDHINLQKSDNRKVNLRVCSQSKNMHNVGLAIDNKTGVKGVSKTTQLWIAKICIKGKIVSKRFATFKEAVVQRKAWEKEYGFLNVPKNKNNKSGITGVSKQAPKWRAQIRIKKRLLSKTFPTFEEAVAQRKAWEQQYNPSGLTDEP